MLLNEDLRAWLCDLLTSSLFFGFFLLQGLVQSLEGSSLASDPNIRVIALYDNEEVLS